MSDYLRGMTVAAISATIMASLGFRAESIAAGLIVGTIASYILDRPSKCKPYQTKASPSCPV
jgi:hypothetical protein